MLDSPLWPCFAMLLAVLVLPGSVLTAVLAVGMVVSAGVFVVRVAVLVRRDAHTGTGFRVVRPHSTAGASEAPATFASSDLNRERGAA